MKNWTKISMGLTGFTALLLISGIAVGQERREPRRGPPQEAFDACDGASDGDSCTVETPEGEVEGECRVPRHEDDRGDMVCVPDHPPEHRR